MSKHWIGLAAVVFLAGACAEEAKSFLANGGFEDITQVARVPKAGGKHGSWMLKGGPQAPGNWTLSSYFGGELSVMSEGAPEGDRFLRIRAGAKREAHIYQLRPQITPGGYYRLSICYRGGPVLIKAYECTEAGRSPRVATVATGKATDPSGKWSRLDGLYYPPRAIKISMVAAVAAGHAADIDDFRVQQEQPKGENPGRGWLNVRDFGASGSEFETQATTQAGSRTVVVANVGDFKVGQGVMISKCHPHYIDACLRGPGSWYRGRQSLDGVAELRGFDGSGGDWLVFVLDIDGEDPLTFRWSDDRARTWKGTRVPITWDWQALSDGLEIKLVKRDLVRGHGITFGARTQLVAVIEKIEGNTLWLGAAPTRSVTNAMVRHCDAAALQATLDLAVRTRQNVYFPSGHYRLEQGLIVRELVPDAALTIEGSSGVHTVMDISDGTGPVFKLDRCKDVTVRNFRMIGHGSRGAGSGARARGRMTTSSGYPYWCMALKSCQAVFTRGTEHVLVENVHASHMANEVFYSQGPSRRGAIEPKRYTKSLTYLRCSVRDSAGNAFNNNDTAEGTSVLYCRVDGVAAYAWEGPARFIKLVGNYVRDSRGLNVGNTSSRVEHRNELGCGQAVVANNVLEGCLRDNGGIVVHYPARQVSVANNLFVNFNGTAVRLDGYSRRPPQPARNAIVTGNVVDLTWSGDKPRTRTGIFVRASDAIVSDNQVYVRGAPDPRVTGIDVWESAVNVDVHDNLVRNCGCGLRTTRARSHVTKVIDERTFLEHALPKVWRTSHLYRGWRLVWLSGPGQGRIATVDAFDPKTCAFALTQPQQVRAGDAFHIYPNSANWNIHGNTITGCEAPVVLGAYGSATTVFRDNVIARGDAKGATSAVVIQGQYKLIGNHISGFDETGATALVLKERRPAGGKVLLMDNLIERCSHVVKAANQGMWQETIKQGNSFIDCEITRE